MNTEEIRQEAKRRIEGMSREEKRNVLGISEEDDQFLDYVEKVGPSRLTEKQEKKFRDILLDSEARSIPGGIEQAGMEQVLEDEFNISRNEIATMAKNPFKAKIIKDLVATLLLNVGAAGFAITGYGAVSIGLEAAAGVFAMGTARQIIDYCRFKKIQKKYASGEMDEELIKYEMTEQILEEREQRWENADRNRSRV